MTRATKVRPKLCPPLFYPTLAEYDQGMRPLLEIVNNPEIASPTRLLYNTLAVESAKNPHPQAVFIPAVHFMVYGARRILGVSSAANRLSSDMLDRSDAASNCVRLIAKKCIENEVFINLYMNNPYLAPMLNLDVGETLYDDINYLGSLGMNAYSETRKVAGGAVRALRHAGVTEGFAEIIGESRGLQLVGLIPKDRDEVWDELGGEFVFKRHLVVEPGSPTRVNFTSEMISYLSRFRSNETGCPARHMPALSAPGTFFQEAWRDNVNYLIPNDQVIIAEH